MKRRRVRRPRVATVPWRALRSVVKVYPVWLELDPLEELLALVQRVNDQRCPPGLRETCATLANVGALDDGARAAWLAILRRHARIVISDENGTRCPIKARVPRLTAVALRVELTSQRGLDALAILMLDADDRTRHTFGQCAAPDCPRFFLVQRRRGRPRGYCSRRCENRTKQARYRRKDPEAYKTKHQTYYQHAKERQASWAFR